MINIPLANPSRELEYISDFKDKFDKQISGGIYVGGENVNIFESNDIGFGWDGNFNGKVIQGSYIYILDFTLNGKKVKQKGKFLLIK